MGSKNQQAVNTAAVDQAIEAKQAAATNPVGVMPSSNVECRMFQIISRANSKATGKETTFLSEAFKGGGFQNDLDLSDLKADELMRLARIGYYIDQVGKTVTCIVSGQTVKYFIARKQRNGSTMQRA